MCVCANIAAAELGKRAESHPQKRPGEPDLSITDQPCQYIRGQSEGKLCSLEIVRRVLAGLAIGNHIERELLALYDAVHAGALNG